MKTEHFSIIKSYEIIKEECLDKEPSFDIITSSSVRETMDEDPLDIPIPFEEHEIEGYFDYINGLISTEVAWDYQSDRWFPFK